MRHWRCAFWGHWFRRCGDRQGEGRSFDVGYYLPSAATGHDLWWAFLLRSSKAPTLVLRASCQDCTRQSTSGSRSAASRPATEVPAADLGAGRGSSSASASPAGAIPSKRRERLDYLPLLCRRAGVSRPVTAMPSIASVRAVELHRASCAFVQSAEALAEDQQIDGDKQRYQAGRGTDPGCSQLCLEPD